ncbi:MAG TPA: hypothetical protein VKP30_21195, partial [Polyangiaceae bacterium]|nr:hypothetical protein [Polyangiaceae bacterium]
MCSVLGERWSVLSVQFEMDYPRCLVTALSSLSYWGSNGGLATDIAHQCDVPIARDNSRNLHR